MGYWKAKSDLEFMNQYKETVINFLNAKAGLRAIAENENYANRYYTEESPEALEKRKRQQLIQYNSIRDQLLKGVGRAKRIAYMSGASTEVTSYPAPLIGGPVLQINVFDTLFQDFTYRWIDEQLALDAINQSIGPCEERVEIERRRLWNPFYWLFQIFKFIIRIPFMLIELSGFDVKKIEEHIISKVFKLLEIGLIAYLLYRIGMNNDQWREVLMKFIGK